jgi:hypothetical protein
MFDETNNPQPTDPPTGTGGGGNTASDLEEPETADALATDPPTGTGGGGGS